MCTAFKYCCVIGDTVPAECCTPTLGPYLLTVNSQCQPCFNSCLHLSLPLCAHSPSSCTFIPGVCYSAKHCGAAEITVHQVKGEYMYTDVIRLVSGRNIQRLATWDKADTW